MLRNTTERAIKLGLLNFLLGLQLISYPCLSTRPHLRTMEEAVHQSRLSGIVIDHFLYRIVAMEHISLVLIISEHLPHLLVHHLIPILKGKTRVLLLRILELDFDRILNAAKDDHEWVGCLREPAAVELNVVFGVVGFPTVGDAGSVFFFVWTE